MLSLVGSISCISVWGAAADFLRGSGKMGGADMMNGLADTIEGGIKLLRFFFWSCILLIFVGIPGACFLGYFIAQ